MGRAVLTDQSISPVFRGAPARVSRSQVRWSGGSGLTLDEGLSGRIEGGGGAHPAFCPLTRIVGKSQHPHNRTHSRTSGHRRRPTVTATRAKRRAGIGWGRRARLCSRLTDRRLDVFGRPGDRAACPSDPGLRL